MNAGAVPYKIRKNKDIFAVGHLKTVEITFVFGGYFAVRCECALFLV